MSEELVVEAHKFNDAPSIQSYFQVSSKDFDIDSQRNILLWFINDKGLDDQFLKYLNHHFPENVTDSMEGRRVSRAEFIEQFEKMKAKLQETKEP